MKRVLIVEDQQEIREILDEVFRKELDFSHVTFATDGLEGYNEAYLQIFDVICTDHSMPFFTGCDMVVAIRNKPGPNQHTPVVMISSFVAEFSSKMDNLESIFFVEKPIDFSRLCRYVKMAMASKKKKSEFAVL